jgi:peptidoglycan hydrolase-like protein with peptidoglycan-binding domain
MDELEFMNGAEIDTRPDSEKIKDFQFEELVSTPAPVVWKEKTEAEWRTFPDQNQDGSGSCVAQTVKRLAGIQMFLKEGKYVDFSATSIYQERSNKPAGGMIGVESFEIWRKNGISLEALVPSQKMNDAQMDAVKIENYEKEIGKIFRINNHVGLPTGDIETVASTIQQTKKGVMVWFFFTSAEWSPLVPVIIDPSLTIAKGLRHSVTAVDYFLYKGQKALLIEDSSHFGKRTRRIVTEDFFKKRNWFARYGTSFNFESGDSWPTKPKHTFLRDLSFSEAVVYDDEVTALQDCLKYEGLFPADRDSTGYYGAVTASAVLAFQKKHKVASNEELDKLQGRRVGEKTRAKLNELFS